MYILNYNILIFFYLFSQFVFTVEGIEVYPGAFFLFCQYFYIIHLICLIFPTIYSRVKKLINMKELLPFSDVAKMYGISESTFRRRLKKLDKKEFSQLTKYVNGKVFIVVNKLSLYEKIEKIEILPFNNEIDIKDNSESENLWKQNEKLLNTISEKDNEIRNLTTMVFKLQNDINGYIKQLSEGSKDPAESGNISDIILKVVLALSLVVLVWYLVFA